ncbi:helix-turn-helix domain-containing protein [Chroococcidiopsis sp. TS-821]|nr:helix-turn-helix domain-containing protein [Chroococcidiopsis sp. TS-821]
MKWCRKQKIKVEPSLEQQGAEKLLEIGAQLYQARQAQALSLERVAMQTMIPRRLLKAIEAGNLEELPEPIYIQSYIKQYADALGLDGTDLARNFPIEDRQLQLKPTQRILPAAQLRPIHLYLLYLFVVFWAVNALSHTLSRNQLQDSSFQRVQQILPTQTRSPQSDIQPVSSANHDSKPVKVSVTLKAQSWLRVTADGKTAFEGTLPQGTQRTWEAKEELTLTTENAGGVLVQFNQEKAQQIGNPGQTQEVTFAAANQRL